MYLTPKNKVKGNGLKQVELADGIKLILKKNFLSKKPAANVKNYSLVSKKSDSFSVSVAATAGCSHGESSGEEMNVQEIVGPINIIALIDGNPPGGGMVAW